MQQEPTIGDALERIYEAGQSLIVRRIDLLVAESKLLARDGGRLALATLVGFLGWVYLVQGAVDGLSTRYPRFTAELLMGFAHVAAAAAFVLYRARSGTDA
jgi:hypothetical protein